MIAGDKRAIINTGSKQGITCPPGDTGYNIAKAGVKVFTEALQHELRETVGDRITAHLLIPGFVFTGLTAGDRTEKPAGAWTPEQTVDFMFEHLTAGDFYILCPDNEVDRPTDERRIAWAAGDLIENRPPLSRWHKDWKAKFTRTSSSHGYSTEDEASVRAGMAARSLGNRKAPMPQKILVLFAHPAYRRSRSNRALRAAVEALDGVTFHDLYETYPDFAVDVDREQALLAEHDVIVCLHPFFWYSAPALVKEWLDLVLEHGWAYGHEGRQLEGKRWLQAVTVGGRQAS